ncbi:zinc finger BED domain-containing protein RICESLEEPER 1-like [Gossypium australe]|uniref:Zinc finger BED domain-containing protein RICESLEEPER 1-like n=1 Tax=Gossypium australe TaxID=47621 RepID=A0A5B6VVK2_9ROSI|nr:zinc finger BED domain-containing protein RICESLEEPER 1-like [Gossypium australe]
MKLCQQYRKVDKILLWLCQCFRELASLDANVPTPSKPSTSTSCSSISLDDDESPVDSGLKDPSILPLTSRHTSSVWIDFTRKLVGDAIKAECNHCSKLLAGGRRANPIDKSDTLTLAPYEFHQEDERRDLLEMIILFEYPISMVEHYGFRKYSKTLQPGSKVSSHNTTKKDIMQRYVSKKENINTLLRKA